MSRKLLSVIIPVYNVERYIERCLRSLLDQDLPIDCYEIIVVNDGSPDNSRDIVVGLKVENRNITLIDQSNMGVSVARNVGMDHASGDYLIFIDPDDYVLPRVFGSALRLIQFYCAQVAFLGFRALREGQESWTDIRNQDCVDKVHSGTIAYRLSRSYDKIDPDRSWGILYERRFINQSGLRFIPGVPYLEDGEFIARTMCLADRCIFSGTLFYIRTTRPGSATNSRLFNETKSVHGFIHAAKNLRELQASSIAQEKKEFLNQPIAKFCLLAIQATVYGSVTSSLNRMANVRSQLFRDRLQRLDLTGCIWLYRRYGFMYNISPFLFGAFWMAKTLVAKVKVTIKFGHLDHLVNASY